MSLLDSYDRAPIYTGFTGLSGLPDKPRFYDTKTLLGAPSGPNYEPLSTYPGNPRNSFSNYEELRSYAEKFGVQDKAEEDKGPGIFTKVMRVLNTGSSLGAGILAGLTDSVEGNTLKRAGQFWSDIDGYGALLRQWGLRDNDWKTKIVRGVLGFAGDVFLDPLTYIPIIGWGVTGIKMLERGGMVFKAPIVKRVFDPKTREWVDTLSERTMAVVPEAMNVIRKAREGSVMSWTEQLTAENKMLGRLAGKPEGLYPANVIKNQAIELAQRDVDNVLIQHVLKHGALNIDAFDESFIKIAGRKNLEELQRLAPTMIDKGGLKLFGKNLLGSKLFSETEVGKAARKIYEDSGLGELVNAMSMPLGKMFVWGFRKTPLMKRLMSNADAEMLATLQKMFPDDWNKTLNRLSKEQQAEVILKVLATKFDQIDEISKEQQALLEKIATEGGDFGKRISELVSGNSGSARAADIVKKSYEREMKGLEKQLAQVVKQTPSRMLKSEELGKKEEELAVTVQRLDDFLQTINKQTESELADILAARSARASRVASGETETEIIDQTTEEIIQEQMIRARAQILQDRIDKLKTQLKALNSAAYSLGFHADIEDVISILNKAGIHITPEDLMGIQQISSGTKGGAKRFEFESAVKDYDVRVNVKPTNEEGRQLFEISHGTNKLTGYYVPKDRQLVLNRFNISKDIKPLEFVVMLDRFARGVMPDTVKPSLSVQIRTSNSDVIKTLENLGLKSSGGAVKKFDTKLGKLIDVVVSERTAFKQFDAQKIEAFLINKEMKKLLFEAQQTYKNLLLHYDTPARVKAKYANREKIQFANPDQQKLADMLWYNEDSIMKQVAKLAGISDDQVFREYVPTVFKDYAIVNGFANGRNYTPKLNQSLGKPSQYWDIEEIKDKLVTDPNELAQRVAKAAVSNKYKMDIVRGMVQGVGLPLRTFQKLDASGKFIGYDYDAALRAGYKKFVVNDPVRKNLRGITRFIEDKEMLKELGIEDINPKIVEGPEQVGGWVPVQVYNELEDLFKRKFSVKDVFEGIAYFDHVTSLTKGYLTSLFPQFHIQNTSSNVFQAMLQAGYGILSPKLFSLSLLMARASEENTLFKGKIFSPEKARNALKKQIIYSRDGKEMTALSFLKAVQQKAPGIFNSSQFSTEELTSNSPIGRMFQGKYNPLDPQNILLKAGREVGATWETQAKIAIILDTWQKGGTIEHGIDLAEEAIFNYSKLTTFEREFMRRLIPFYTFARKNAEYQMRKLLIAPGYTAAQYKFFNNLDYSLSDGFGTDKDNIPAFMREQFGFGVGPVGHGGVYYNSFGLPIEEFLGRLNGNGGMITNLIRSTISSTNPIIKYPLELGTGQDIFRQRPIVELSTPDQLTSMISGMDNVVGRQFRKLIDYREGTVPVYKDGEVVGYRTKAYANPYMLHFIRSLPTSRFSTVVSQQYDAVEQLQNKSDMQKIMSAVMFWAGINITVPDAERQKFFDDLQKYRELGDWMQRAGFDVRKFETYYRQRSQEEKRFQKYLSQ